MMDSKKDLVLLSKTEEKRTVFVHVTFLKVGEIDTQKECFEADVLFRAKWRAPEHDHINGKATLLAEAHDLDNHWNPGLYIDNVIGEAKRSSSGYIEYREGRAYVTERRRVKATFMENMELWDFPFDIQDLSVTLTCERGEVALVDDAEELHLIHRQSFIDEQEWYLYKYTESIQSEMVRDLADPTQVRSALTIRCRSARRPHYYIWNSFSVTLVICLLSLITFAVKISLPQNRIGLNFTLLLTNVAYRFTVHQTLPRISYLSYLDRYMLGALLSLGLVCFYQGSIALVARDHDLDPAQLLLVDRCVVAGCGAVHLLYNAVFVVLIMTKPMQLRRDMVKKENAYVRRIQDLAEKKKSRGTEKLGHVNLAMVSDDHSYI